MIRGEASDDAVLCTEDKTFELRAADMSNMLLLTPSLRLHGDNGAIKSAAQLRHCFTLRTRVDVFCIIIMA